MPMPSDMQGWGRFAQTPGKRVKLVNFLRQEYRCNLSTAKQVAWAASDPLGEYAQPLWRAVAALRMGVDFAPGPLRDAAQFVLALK